MIVAVVGVLELSSCRRLEGVGEADYRNVSHNNSHFHALVFLDTVNIPMYTDTILYSNHRLLIAHA